MVSDQINREVDLGPGSVCARVRSVVGIQITLAEVKGAGRCVVGRVDFRNRVLDLERRPQTKYMRHARD